MFVRSAYGSYIESRKAGGMEEELLGLVRLVWWW